MGKIFGVTICALLGIGILTLSLISDTLVCSDNICQMQSSIPQLKITISQDTFATSEIKSVSCVQTAQPSRSGNRYYYILKLVKKDGSEYNLGSYKKHPNCKENLKPINDIRRGKSKQVTYSSGSGFNNCMGFIFGILMFFIGFMILTSKPDNTSYDWEDEEPDNDEINNNKHSKE